MRPRRWHSRDGSHRWGPRWIAGSAAVVLLVTGCGGGDARDDTSTTGTAPGAVTFETPSPGSPPSTPSADDVEQALARLREAMARTPDAISADFTRYGATALPPQQVHELARQLCGSQFLASTVTPWLGSDPSVLLLPTTQRLLDYAGTPEVCNRPATDDEAAAYSSAVFARLAPTRPAGLDIRVPSPAESVVCELLGSEAGGATAETVIDGLLEAATRGRYRGGDAVAFGVQIAGTACPEVLPVAVDAVAEYFQTQPAG